MTNKYLSWVMILMRLALAAIFIGASFYKIQSPGTFAHQIYNYQFLPNWVINPMAILVPWLQLFCGICLLFNQWAEAANILIILMLSAFQIAVASALARGLNISCGCFKSGGSPATWLTFGRDSTILILSLIYFWWIFERKPIKKIEISF